MWQSARGQKGSPCKQHLTLGPLQIWAQRREHRRGRNGAGQGRVSNACMVLTQEVERGGRSPDVGTQSAVELCAKPARCSEELRSLPR